MGPGTRDDDAKPRQQYSRILRTGDRFSEGQTKRKYCHSGGVSRAGEGKISLRKLRPGMVYLQWRPGSGRLYSPYWLSSDNSESPPQQPGVSPDSEQHPLPRRSREQTADLKLPSG